MIFPHNKNEHELESKSILHLEQSSRQRFRTWRSAKMCLAMDNRSLSTEMIVLALFQNLDDIANAHQPFL